MSDPVPALNGLLEEMTRRGSPLGSHLEPGMPAGQVPERIRDAGGEPHPDVVALYAWHNGFDRFRVPTSPNGMVSLVPSHQEFNALAEALDDFKQRRASAEKLSATPLRDTGGGWTSIDPEAAWSRAWFPVFQGPGGEAIFIDNCEADNGSVWLDPVQDAPRRLFDSLADAIEAVRHALVEGRLELDATGVFEFESTMGTGLEL
jgi:cell wall assembly regulator SMI1